MGPVRPKIITEEGKKIAKGIRVVFQRGRRGEGGGVGVTGENDEDGCMRYIHCSLEV